MTNSRFRTIEDIENLTPQQIVEAVGRLTLAHAALM